MFQDHHLRQLLIGVAKIRLSNMSCPLEMQHAGNGEGKNRQPRHCLDGLSATGNHDSRTGPSSAHLSRKPLSPSLPPRMELTIGFTLLRPTESMCLYPKRKAPSLHLCFRFCSSNRPAACQCRDSTHTQLLLLRYTVRILFSTVHIKDISNRSHINCEQIGVLSKIQGATQQSWKLTAGN